MFATIGLIIDIAIVIALLVYGFIGLRKGFLKSVLSLFNWAVCLVLSIYLAKYMNLLLNKIFDFAGFIGKRIENSLIKSDIFYSTTVSAYGSANDIINNIPSSTGKLMTQIIKIAFSNNGKVDMASNRTVGNLVGASIGNVVTLVLSAIIVFIVLKLVLALLSKLFDNISKTKVMGGLNKILGFIFGVVKSGIVIIAINILLVALTLIPMVNKTFTPLIQENTYVEKVIYNKTDDAVEKYIIKGDVIQKWISTAWDKR